MSTVSQSAREIQAKIVYYGPGLSGKTTTLRSIHGQVRPETRGQLVSLATEGDRTLFFDFLPLKVEQVNGLSLRLQLYTVPGQIFYEATRKLVLHGADGVVFVADSQPAAMDANLESLASLERNLLELGLDPAAFPLVLQWNKRDIAGVLPTAELRAALNARGAPEFETVASRGQGTMEALKEVTRLVMAALRARPPAPPPVAAARSPTGSRSTPMPRSSLSFARLFPGGAAGVIEVEQAIRDGRFGDAVKAAAQGVSDVLASLELEERSDTARAALLGLDGRDYLRLLRLSRLPLDMGSEADALFSLHVLVAVKLRADAI